MIYAIRNFVLLDGTENMVPQTGKVIFVKNGIIDTICNEGEHTTTNMRIIDLKGQYLCPGLIDLHVHLPGTGKPVSVSILPKDDGTNKGVKETFRKSMESGFANKVLTKIVKKSLTDKLASGVTTVRSMGELYWSDLYNRNQINEGKYIGPRLLVSGVGITVPKGHMAGTMGVICKTEEDCRKAVAIACEKGVDWIKIFVTGGVLDASENGEPAALRMNLPLAKAACDEAHKRGLRVASHAESAEGVRVSLDAGVDTVEHGSPLNTETEELFKKNRSSFTVTISPAIAIAKLPGKVTGIDDVGIEASNYVMNGMVKGAKECLKAGIPVGLGTDASCPYVTQYDFWREIFYFHKLCGVSTKFALHTATLKNAEILGLQDEIGSIEEGKSADFIVVDENPLEDLTTLRYVNQVFIKGEYIENPKLKKNVRIERALEPIINELKIK